MILSEMYARIKYVSEIQFRPKIKVPLLQDWSFSSYHYMDDIVNRIYVKWSPSSNNNNNSITEKKRILIVDDDLDIANLYKLSLEHDGFFVEILMTLYWRCLVTKLEHMTCYCLTYTCQE